MAQSFFDSKTFSLWGTLVGYPQPLYPVILSIAYAFGDITFAYPIMKIINAFLSSLIVIPVFLISKEFISIKKSIIVAFLSSLLPASFSFTSAVMSENLFYPLFMFSLFFMLKSLTEDDKKWDLMCGLSIGLSILTRLPGLVLLVILFFVLLIKGTYMLLSEGSITTKVRKIFLAFIDKWCIFLSSAVVALPWFLRNGYYFGFNSRGLTGGSISMAGGLAKYGGSQPTNIPVIDFIYWAMMHTGYFIFATGIILFALAMLQTWKIVKQKSINKTTYANTKLSTFLIISWVSFTTLVLFCAYQKFHGGPYLMGRYIAPILPAFMVMGAVGLDSFTKRDFKPIFGTLIVCSFSLAFLPINSFIRAYNTPDAYVLLVPQRLYEMGVLSFEPNVIFIKLFLLILPFFFLILAKKNALKWKCIAPLLLVFFVVNSVVASGVMYAASTDAQDEMKVGLWLHDHAPKNSVIIFDERDADRMNWAIWGTMFWTDNIIEISNVSAIEADYIVSLHRLNLPLVLEVDTETEVIKSYDNHYFVYNPIKVTKGIK
ncbi:MAG: glycosyltransferase family 39 protein [Methanocellales archaeon]|nr:glycosyltransferase family 39 protein [Methanocellales archaeon]MDD5446422.1 glycosyltransferase family 39 protein [Methanocellales archaeon]